MGWSCEVRGSSRAARLSVRRSRQYRHRRQRVAQFNLAELHDDGDVVELEANDNAVILFGHADPMQEPIAARGPFVMNTQAELNQAFADFRAGKFNVPAG
ncbi:pirin-like C-terminal cupin domain-containing protein [Paraburkholderia fungorum]